MVDLTGKQDAITIQDEEVKKNKVFLFETATEEQNRNSGLTDEGAIQFPIGLAYLAAILNKNGYNVLTKDYTYWTEERCLKEVKKQIEQFKPNFVGIAVMTMTRVSTYKAIKMIKKINPNIKIILGGMHSSMMYEQLLNNFPIDAVCIGEAEESLVKLLDAINNNNKSMDNINGIAFKKGNKIIVTPKIVLTKSIDELPYPNYDLFINKSITQVKISTSRGCPNKCSFCCLHITSNQRWRARDPVKVVDEIEFIHKKYPWVDTIEIIDDTFTIDNNRVITICQQIINRGIKLKFRCQGRIKPVSREMFYWMEKAGFFLIGFGIETGAESLLKSIHKDITKQDCINTFNILKEFPKLKPVRFLIVGFPGETEETIRETTEFAVKLHKTIPMDYFLIGSLWIYPGTEIYDYAKSKGWIDDEYWLTDKPCPYFTMEHPIEWLIEKRDKITIECMLAQGKIVFIKKAIKNLITSPKHYFKRAYNYIIK